MQILFCQHAELVRLVRAKLKGVFIAFVVLLKVGSLRLEVSRLSGCRGLINEEMRKSESLEFTLY